MVNPSAFFLVGPTASGKSNIAHILAQKMSCNVVSADSMNIYKDMDIGTAKPSLLDRDVITYKGVDIVSPTISFSVVDWLNMIYPVWKDSSSPIVVGGTGLYIKCLLAGIDEDVNEDSQLREALKSIPIEELQIRIKKELPHLYNTLTKSERQNPRRLIRLLERRKIGKSWKRAKLPTIVGLYIERKALHQRIAVRVENMYQNGLLDEAERLNALALSKTARQAIGYAEAFDVINGVCSQHEAIEKTIIRTRQLAKRQMTWFNNQLNLEWVNVDEYNDNHQIADAVYQAWQKYGSSEVII